MAYTLTSAADVSALFSALNTFASANGWTVDWQTGSQIGLHSGNCYAAFGTDGTTNPTTVTDTYPTPDVNYSDFRIYGALSSSFASGQEHYWGHPDSLVTTATDGDRVALNDLMGPFDEVHFFGDERYIIVMLRTDDERWTHFAFGLLDGKGMTTPDVAFMLGVYHEWWNNSTTSVFGTTVNIKAAMRYNSNRFWMDNVSNNVQYYVPSDGVVDPAYSIPTGVLASPCQQDWVEFGSNGPAALEYGARPGLLDHWGWSYNKPTTGGVPLLSLPVLIRQYNNDTSLTQYMGDIPGIRLCIVSNLAIGEEIAYGSEVYLPFPLKRRASGSYDGKPSTYGWGVAIKKVL